MGNILKFETKLDERGRILVPRDLRKELSGRKIYLIYRNGQLRIVPKIPLKELAGITPDITLAGIRDEKDRTL